MASSRNEPLGHSLTPERWQQVKSVLSAALETDPAERPSFLDKACATDPALRLEVENLLSIEEHSLTALLQPILPVFRESPDGVDSRVGRRIGPYQLAAEIGIGGMGEVYRAFRADDQYKKEVAIKLVRAGQDSKFVVARFKNERQVLASLDHPNIARLLDGGTTEDGIPYFVMELIEGQPIDEYCDRHGLTIGERLRVFLQVCAAVQFAHQRLIIHRDIKPGNILVGADRVPKLLDFGIAKLLDATSDRNDATITVFRALTPAYTSPEQIQGGPVTTACDVYSLGVVLYELLTGHSPYRVASRTAHELAQAVLEAEPERPSTAVTRTATRGSGADPTQITAASTAAVRAESAEKLRRSLRGDLDAIALKALEKERSRRYASASEFAADIKRYLNHEAVLAVSPSLAYRARKFARRYRLVLATASAFALVLVVAAAVSIRESIRANREAAASAAVSGFLQNDLLAQAGASAQSGPTAKPDPDLKVRTALDRAAGRIEGKFARQPEVEAAIRDTIGQTYRDLGLYSEASKQLERALDLRRRVLGPEHRDTLKSMNNLARVYWDEAKYVQAEALDHQTLETMRRVLGPEHPDTLKSMNNLATDYEREAKYAQAEALDSQTLQIKRRGLGPEHPDTLKSMSNLALVYYDEGKYAQAETLDSQTLEIMRPVMGPEHPDTLMTMNNLAIVYWAEGKYAQAEALDRQTLEIRRRVLGPEHGETLGSMNNLADDYYSQGKYAQAEVLFSQALEIQRRVLGPEHRDTLGSMNNLAEDYDSQGKYVQAEVLFSQALEIQRRVFGPEHPNTLTSMEDLANVYSYQRKYVQAEALHNQTLEIQRRVFGPEHPATLETVSDIASMYQRQGKYLLAETYSAQALAGRRHALGPEHPDTMASAADLALAYLSQGKFRESESLAREALEFNQKNQSEDWPRFRAESLLGAALAGQKKYAEAEPLLLSGYQGMIARKERIDVPDWYHLDRAREWLVQLYQASGKPDKGAEWRKK